MKIPVTLLALLVIGSWPQAVSKRVPWCIANTFPTLSGVSQGLALCWCLDPSHEPW